MGALFTTRFEQAQSGRLKGELQAKGFQITRPPYTLFQARGAEVVCTLYASGKLVVQGKGTSSFVDCHLTRYRLDGSVLQGRAASSSSGTGACVQQGEKIGIDESGKGDLFGPLVVCAFYADEQGVARLERLGVQESKKVSDATSIRLAEELRANFQYSLVRLSPARYNHLYARFGNLNHLLAWGHSFALARLLKQVSCRRVLVDQFAQPTLIEESFKARHLEVELEQRFRAEEDLVVAGASLLARASFLEDLQRLERRYRCRLPKGAAAHVKEVLRRLLIESPEMIGSVCKTHFKTLDLIKREEGLI